MHRSLKYEIISAFLVALAVVVATTQTLLDPNPFIYNNIPYSSYNNFLIFRQSFFHLADGLDLYARYAAEHADFFKYSPTFALFMGLFWPLSPQVGLFVWNLLGAVLIFLGLRSLITGAGARLICVLLLIPELHTSALNSQSNNHIAGLLMLSFAALERGRSLPAAATLVSTFFVKLFGLVMAPVVLMYANRSWKILFTMLCVGVVLALAPLVLIGPGNLADQYRSWIGLLRFDHEISLGISAAGLLSAFGVPVNKNLLLVAASLALLCPLLKPKQFSDPIFRSLYFVFCLLWMVLLNHKAESPTFIIAMCGVVYFGHIGRFRGESLVFVIMCFLLTSLSASDLVPREIRHTIVEPYRIKALAPTVLMIFLFFRMMSFQGSVRASGPQ